MIFISCSHLKVSTYLVEKIFVFLLLELAHQAECFFEIYALDIVSRLLLISMAAHKVGFIPITDLQ